MTTLVLYHFIHNWWLIICILQFPTTKGLLRVIQCKVFQKLRNRSSLIWHIGPLAKLMNLSTLKKTSTAIPILGVVFTVHTQSQSSSASVGEKKSTPVAATHQQVDPISPSIRSISLALALYTRIMLCSRILTIGDMNYACRKRARAPSTRQRAADHAITDLYGSARRGYLRGKKILYGAQFARVQCGYR